MPSGVGLMPHNTGRLDAVQILRAAAALAVTFAHAYVPVADLAASQKMPNPLPGAAMANGGIGVDLFFVATRSVENAASPATRSVVRTRASGILKVGRALAGFK